MCQVQASKKVNVIEESDVDPHNQQELLEKDDVFICQLESNPKKFRPSAHVNFKFNGKLFSTECLLDSGADVNIIGFTFLCKMLNCDDPKLKKSTIVVKAF